MTIKRGDYKRGAQAARVTPKDALGPCDAIVQNWDGHMPSKHLSPDTNFPALIKSIFKKWLQISKGQKGRSDS